MSPREGRKGASGAQPGLDLRARRPVGRICAPWRGSERCIWGPTRAGLAGAKARGAHMHPLECEKGTFGAQLKGGLARLGAPGADPMVRSGGGTLLHPGKCRTGKFGAQPGRAQGFVGRTCTLRSGKRGRLGPSSGLDRSGEALSGQARLRGGVVGRICTQARAGKGHWGPSQGGNLGPEGSWGAHAPLRRPEWAFGAQAGRGSRAQGFVGRNCALKCEKRGHLGPSSKWGGPGGSGAGRGGAGPEAHSRPARPGRDRARVRASAAGPGGGAGGGPTRG